MKVKKPELDERDPAFRLSVRTNSDPPSQIDSGGRIAARSFGSGFGSSTFDHWGTTATARSSGFTATWRGDFATAGAHGSTTTLTTSLAGFAAAYLAAALLNFATARSSGLATARSCSSGLAATSRSGFAAGSGLAANGLTASLLAALVAAVTEQASFGIRHGKASDNHDQSGQCNQYIFHNNPSSWEKSGGIVAGTLAPSCDATISLCHRQSCFVPRATTVGSGGEVRKFFSRQRQRRSAEALAIAPVC